VAPESAGATAPYPGARNPVKLARGAGSFPGQFMGAEQAGIRQWARRRAVPAGGRVDRRL